MNTTDALEKEIEAKADLALPPMTTGPLAAYALAPIDQAKQLLPVPIEVIRDVALMVSRVPGLAKGLQTQECCEALVLQAATWRISPLFVAQNAYRAKPDGPIGYEAKLIHAVILTNAPLQRNRRPRLAYGYAGGKQTAANRFVKATAWVVGEAEPFTVTTPTVSQIKVKNSPLWFSDPDQQLAYYVFRSLARRYFPDVLGGAYTREEIVQLQFVDAMEAARGRQLFEDEPAPIQDAEFEDNIPPTDQDDAHFSRWEKKASGEGDSRDPRDAPTNSDPAQSQDGPDDMAEIRAWAAGEQTRILGLKDQAAVTGAAIKMTQDKRYGRLKAYDQPIANAIRDRLAKHLEDLKAQAK